MTQASATDPALATTIPAPSALGRWAPRLILLLILGAYSLFLYSNFAPAISTPDSDGYWAQASLLATTGKTWFVPKADTQYIGIHWLITPDGKYISRYPPGLPVVVAAIYELAGYKAAVMLDPILAVLTLLGLYLLARRVVSRWWAVAAALLLVSLPIFTQHALASESHMTVTFCLVWGTYLLLRWANWPTTDEQEPRATPTLGRRLPLAFLAGLLLGFIPTVRYPEALLALGIGIFLLSQIRRYPRISMDYAALALGAAIPITALLIRNQFLLGAFWRTGYALTHEQTGFSWFYFKTHFFQYIRAIQSDGLGTVFVLGVAGIAWMCMTRRVRALGVLLLLESVAMIGLYMAYYWAPEGGNMVMRFLLPLFPGFILAGVWMLSSATQHAPRMARVAVCLAVVTLQLLWGGGSVLASAKMLHYQQDLLARVTDGLEQVSSHGDVVIASDQIQRNLDFVHHWRLVDLSPDRFPGMLGRMPAWAVHVNMDTPMPMQGERFLQKQQRYDGMDDEEREQAIAADIQKWAGRRPIYFVGTVAEIQQASALMLGSGSAADRGRFQVVSRIALPERPRMNDMGGPIWVAGGFGVGVGDGGPGGPMGAGGPPDGFGAGGPPPRMGPPPRGSMMPGGRAGDGAGRGPFRPGGGPMGGGSLAGQYEAIIARWVPAKP